MFRLTFLGTSSGVPTRERNVSGLAVECIHKDENAKNHPWILIDCGEGTQQQIIKSHLSTGNLRAIFITHIHGDHCYGLAGLLASLGMQSRTTPLMVVAPKAIAKLLDTFSLLTELHFNYPIEFMAIEDLINQEHKIINDVMNETVDFLICFNHEHEIHVTIHELSHRSSSYGFSITQIIKSNKLNIEKLNNNHIEKSKWKDILYANEKNKSIMIDNHNIIPQDYINSQTKQLKIVIAGDNDTPKLLTKAVKNAKAMVHEATYTHEIMQKIMTRGDEAFNPQHSSAKMVAQFAQSVDLPILLLTHFSPRYASFDNASSHKPNMGHIKAEVSEYYQGQLILAKDFLSVLIDENGYQKTNLSS
ncbi:MAG: ribonuclease Z [Moraxella sp.]|nr:ribonuclease Z [Moraxella sp.]